MLKNTIIHTLSEAALIVAPRLQLAAALIDLLLGLMATHSVVWDETLCLDAFRRMQRCLWAANVVVKEKTLRVMSSLLSIAMQTDEEWYSV
jgi:hypothetical protein